MPKTINFGAGPAKIPEPVMEKAQREFLDFNNTGISVLEMSHRSGEFTNLLNATKKLLKEEMSIPNEYEVLFFQGGGSGQFAAVPMNLAALSKNKDSPTADYAVTGAWSSKAAEEASKYLNAKKVFEVKKPFSGPPDESTWNRNPEAAYLYYCDNETVHGVEFPSAPSTLSGVPLVADVSSNFLSRKFDFTGHGLVFGGTQKNLGASGLTIAIVRSDLIGHEHPFTPGVFSYKEMHKNNSVYNTPTTYSIYLTKLVLEWIRDNGGVDGLYEKNRQKSDLLYGIIDRSGGFYTNPVEKNFRSKMNVPFRVGGGNETLETDFIKKSVEKGMISLKGHRSVGGIRASIYNSVTLEEVEILGDFMKEFQEKHGSEIVNNAH
ncbi:hypothetical protein FO519_006199 [Halicephalobus sp. NKZ332]|nr:hypothetical protein FO519_006199 [Halicephalobus sp. NKZ332]